MAGFYDLIKAQSSSLIEEDLLLRAGKTWHTEWWFLDTEDNLVNFTGATARCDFKSAADDSIIATFTNGGAQFIVQLGTGNVALVAPASATKLLATSGDVDFYYEVEITLSDRVLAAVVGKGTIKKEITTSG